jgi:hypothetical protein
MDPWAAFLRPDRRFGRAELVVVMDTTHLDEQGQPTLHWDLPVPVSWPVIRAVLGDARVRPVVIDRGRIVGADAELNLGRRYRAASAAQHRALRARYGGCAVNGCGVPYAYTYAHHLEWWEHGGLTDIDNLIPLCSRHHHRVHDDGWIVTIHPDRSVELHPPPATESPPDESASDQ